MDRVIVTTEETAKGFIGYYPFLSPEKVIVVSQGYDPEEFRRVTAEKGKCFRIVYTGVFYDDIREPYTFFDAVESLRDIQLEIIVAGNILPQHVKAVRERGLESKIKFLGHQAHERTVALQKGADLLLFLSYNSPYQLPGKIFEYFVACRPILAIQFVAKDIAARLIRKHNCGIVVFNEAEEIASAIRKVYDLWQRGKIEERFRTGPVKEYQWESQAEKLEAIIKNLLNDS